MARSSINIGHREAGLSPATWLSLVVPIDFQKRDDAQAAAEMAGGTKPSSESEVVNHEIGHALHFVEDPIQVANADAEDLEPTANGFAKKVANEKNSMSEPDAKKRVHEILGLEPPK